MEKRKTFMELATKQAEGYTRELIAFLLRSVFRTPCGRKPWGCLVLNSLAIFAACASQSNFGASCSFTFSIPKRGMMRKILSFDKDVSDELAFKFQIFSKFFKFQ